MILIVVTSISMYEWKTGVPQWLWSAMESDHVRMGFRDDVRLSWDMKKSHSLCSGLGLADPRQSNGLALL